MREAERGARQLARQLRQTMTRVEALLWSFIRRRALAKARFRCQHSIGPYVADFACVAVKLVVEVDGPRHWTLEKLGHDGVRTAFLEREGWTVLRVTNTEVLKNLHGVWRSIESRLLPPAAAPPPPPQAGKEDGERSVQ